MYQFQGLLPGEKRAKQIWVCVNPPLFGQCPKENVLFVMMSSLLGLTTQFVKTPNLAFFYAATSQTHNRKTYHCASSFHPATQYYKSDDPKYCNCFICKAANSNCSADKQNIINLCCAVWPKVTFCQNNSTETSQDTTVGSWPVLED